MMVVNEITVGNLTSFLMYSAYVGISVVGEFESVIVLQLLSPYLHHFFFFLTCSITHTPRHVVILF